MIEKIKAKIEENKKDKSTFKEYIRSFCESEKVQEYYKDNSDFNELKKSYAKNKKIEEEEY